MDYKHPVRPADKNRSMNQFSDREVNLQVRNLLNAVNELQQKVSSLYRVVDAKAGSTRPTPETAAPTPPADPETETTAPTPPAEPKPKGKGNPKGGKDSA